jgi:hypothetical protein
VRRDQPAPVRRGVDAVEVDRQGALRDELEVTGQRDRRRRPGRVARRTQRHPVQHVGERVGDVQRLPGDDEVVEEPRPGDAHDVDQFAGPSVEREHGTHAAVDACSPHEPRAGVVVEPDQPATLGARGDDLSGSGAQVTAVQRPVEQRTDEEVLPRPDGDALGVEPVGQR